MVKLMFLHTFDTLVKKDKNIIFFSKINPYIISNYFLWTLGTNVACYLVYLALFGRF